MKVRMVVEVSGTRNGQPWPPYGSVLDLPDAEALDYIRAGQAVRVSGGEVKQEKATADDSTVESREAAARPAKASGRRTSER